MHRVIQLLLIVYVIIIALGLPHRSSVLHLNLASGLGRRVVGMVLVLLLLLSGDIETNPGPVGEFCVSN